MNFFGASTTKEATKQREETNMKDRVKEWQKQLKGEMRGMDREIAKIQRAEQKTKMEMKKLAAKKEIGAVKILAKEVVRTRKHVERLYMAKTQMNSVCMELTAQQATMKMAQSMQMSTQITKQMNKMMNLPELQKTMAEMQKEMMKAGLVGEMVDEVLDEQLGADEDAEDEMVASIYSELALTDLMGVEAISNNKIAQKEKQTAPAQQTATAEEDDLEARMAALTAAH